MLVLRILFSGNNVKNVIQPLVRLFGVCMQLLQRFNVKYVVLVPIHLPSVSAILVSVGNYLNAFQLVEDFVESTTEPMYLDGLNGILISFQLRSPSSSFMLAITWNSEERVCAAGAQLNKCIETDPRVSGIHPNFVPGSFTVLFIYFS